MHIFVADKHKILYETLLHLPSFSPCSAHTRHQQRMTSLGFSSTRSIPLRGASSRTFPRLPSATMSSPSPSTARACAHSILRTTSVSQFTPPPCRQTAWSTTTTSPASEKETLPPRHLRHLRRIRGLLHNPIIIINPLLSKRCTTTKLYFIRQERLQINKSISERHIFSDIDKKKNMHLVFNC